MRTVLAATVAAAAFFSVSACAATFAGSNVNLVGNAVMLDNGNLQLTTGGWNNGAAWATSALSTTTSFSTTFGFSMAKDGFNGNMADGIALVLQNQGTGALGHGGGDIGYGGLNGVGSVIQTWTNNRIGLDITGNPNGASVAAVSLGAASLVTGQQTVSYNATTHVLSMTGNYVADGTSHALSDATQIDLSARFGSTMYLGFTGATGGSYADQRITNFTVAAVPEPETYAMLLAGLGLVGFASRRKVSKAAKAA